MDVVPAVVIDDEAGHAAGFAGTLISYDMPCEMVHFKGDAQDVAAFPDARFIVFDLHLVPGSRDPKADFGVIAGLLRDSIKPTGPYAIFLWTMYPNDAEGLRQFLRERLDDFHKPVSVYPLTKLLHLDDSGRLRNEKALFEEVRMAIDEAEMLIRNTPDRAKMEAVLRRLFGDPEAVSQSQILGVPGLNVRLEEWMSQPLPSMGMTPKEMLESNDPGNLFLLERLVHSIATLRASMHPQLVRDIVQRRVETMYDDGVSLEFIGGPQTGEDRTPDDRQRWMDTRNAFFGDCTPQQFFESSEVDVPRLSSISARLDAIDEGAFS